MKKGNLKIRMKERGTMRAFLIAKSPHFKPGCLRSSDSQLVSWMFQCYGYNHWRLWRQYDHKSCAKR